MAGRIYYSSTLKEKPYQSLTPFDWDKTVVSRVESRYTRENAMVNILQA